MRRSAVLPLVLALQLAAEPALPCTTFCMRAGSEVLVGKNYDWDGSVVSVASSVRALSA